MGNETAQPLNYSAHALEDLRHLQSTWSAVAPLSAHVLERVITMLEASVKFILPNCCELIAPDELRQAHVDIARLPFPCVAFEAPWQTGTFVEHRIGGFDQQEVTKRIALCWEARSEFEPRPGLNSFLDIYPQGGVFVLPIFWGPDTNGWIPAAGGTFSPYDDVLRDIPLTDVPKASQLSIAAAIESGMVKADGQHHIAEPFALFPEMFDVLIRRCGSKDEANSSIMLDSRDESFIRLQVCAVLGCANVKTTELPPSEKLNKKRMAKGNQPFFSYKVLELSDERSRGRTAAQGGTHAGPRMHLRRGHIRRLQSGRATFVRSAMVNANSPRGSVAKDYKLR